MIIVFLFSVFIFVLIKVSLELEDLTIYMEEVIEETKSRVKVRTK